jgi:hypothetical protein
VRRHRLPVLLPLGAGVALFPVPVGAQAGTDPGHRAATSETAGQAVPDRMRATTGSTSVTFRVLGPTPPPPTPTPTPDADDGAGEGPSSFAESGNDGSVALDADNGAHGSSWSGTSGGHRSHGSGHRGRHGSPRHGQHAHYGHRGQWPAAGPRHRAAHSGPQRGRLPFTGGDIRSTALAGLAATLAGAVALCLAAVRRRRQA